MTQSSSVEYALQVREIFEHIVAHVVAESQGPADKHVEALIAKTLISLGMTCRDFRDPALAALWRSLDSLHPLLQLLPAFVKRGSRWLLSGSLDAEACPRFHFYRHCVKQFCWDDRAGGYYHVAVLLRLASLPGGLFPHLQDLSMKPHFNRFSAVQNTVSVVPALFAAPTISCLRIIISKNVPDREDPDTPLEWHTETAAYFAVSADYIFNMNHLRLLHIEIRDGVFSFDIVHALSLLSGLRNLILIGFRANQQGDWTRWNALYPSALPVLEEVHFSLPLNLITSILHWISSPHLSTVSLKFKDAENTPARSQLWKSCHDSLSRSRSCLNSLKISTIHSYLIPFRDLFGFPQLRLLMVPMEFVEGDLPELAIGLNMVRKLWLEGLARQPVLGRTAPSIQSLKWFQLHCPNLRYLSLTVDDKSQVSSNDTAALESAEATSGRVLDHGLRVIELNGSQFSNPFSVVRDLNMTFPNLTEICANDNALGQSLQTCLTDFQSIREHERTRFLRLLEE